MPTATTAKVVQPDTSPYPVSAEQIGGIGSFVIAAIGAVLYLRRRLPKDKLEALKDRTEGLMLTQAFAERDKALADAREAWSQLNAMQFKQGSLVAENEFLRREVTETRAEITAIRQGVMQVGRRVDKTEDKLTAVERRVGTTNPAPLGDK